MFTGIVQAVGKVAELAKAGRGARLRAAAPAGALRGLKRGDSVAVNGCCLTIVQRTQGGFSADLAAETLAKTSLGGLAPGARVNLEAPLRVGDALSGHILQGHIEGVGKLLALTAIDAQAGWRLRVRVPGELLPYMVAKGSLAVDGISLTIAALEGDVASFAIIPFTYAHTHLAHLKKGAAMNLETDPMARHLERLLAARQAAAGPALEVAALRRQGF